MRVIGIDVGGTYIKAGAVEQGKVIEEKMVSTTRTPKELIHLIAELTRELKGERLGIAMPGPLTKDGVVCSPPNFPGLKNWPLKELLEQELKISVCVGKDSNCMALGEWKYGVGIGKKNLLVLTLGTGVGGGIIINNKLYIGEEFAGEIGHITIDANGPPCGCGNYGCLEAFIGSHYLEERAKRGIKLGVVTSLADCEEITPERISTQAKAGDKFALELIQEYGYYLGVGIASAAALLDPERVIIGGGVSKAGEVLFEKVRATVQRRLYTRTYLDIVPAKLGDRGGILGSALYAELF